MPCWVWESSNVDFTIFLIGNIDYGLSKKAWLKNESHLGLLQLFLVIEALNHGKLAKHLHCPSSGHLSEVRPHFQTSSLDGIPWEDGDCKIRSRIRGEEESVKNTCSVERQVKAILVLNLPVNLPVLDLAVHWPVGRFWPSQTCLEREHHESHRVCLSWDWVSCIESTQRSTQHTSGAHVMAVCVVSQL